MQIVFKSFSEEIQCNFLNRELWKQSQDDAFFDTCISVKEP